jgi:hypothetical protein
MKYVKSVLHNGNGACTKSAYSVRISESFFIYFLFRDRQQTVSTFLLKNTDFATETVNVSS